MKNRAFFRWLAYFFGDSLRYLLVPFLAAIMPRRLAGAWLTLASKWRWIFPERDRVRDAIDQCFDNRPVGVEQVALTLLNESTTAWKLLIGRRLRVRQHAEWPSTFKFVAAGGHFGSGLSVLWSLKQAGLQPCFMLHRPVRDWRRSRPIVYYWSCVRFKLIERICSGNLIVTGGARKKLQTALKSGSVTPVVLFDTPDTPSNSNWTLPVGKLAITLPEGARDIVAESAWEVVLFRPLTNIGEVDAELYLERLDPAAGLAEEFPKKFSDALAESPAEWHFWPIIRPYLHDPKNTKSVRAD